MSTYDTMSGHLSAEELEEMLAPRWDVDTVSLFPSPGVRHLKPVALDEAHAIAAQGPTSPVTVRVIPPVYRGR